MPTWKEKLADRMDPQIAEEIDVFETQIALRRKENSTKRSLPKPGFGEACYGQRYDNGHRHDGIRTQQLHLPERHDRRARTRSGMRRECSASRFPLAASLRINWIPWRISPKNTADGVLHVTTRQDFQLHYVHIDDTPNLMRRLAAVGITTREACGNSVRNVTACPLAGVCRTEAFDVTPYAKAAAKFMLGHPDAQGFGRKFKIAFSGCREEACAPDQHARHGLHRRHSHRKRQRETRLRGLCRRRAWAPFRIRPNSSMRLFPKKNCCR